MFTFIEEMEGVDFKGALRLLADKAGVELTPEAPGARDERERVYEALTAAADYFTSVLKERPDARAYLLSRGLTEETIESWSLGYAPKEWRALHEHLTAEGFAEGILERAGLVKKPDSPESGVSLESRVSLEMRDERLEVGGKSKESETLNSQLSTPDSRASRAYDRFRGRIMFPIRDVSGRVIAFSGRIFEDDSAHPQAKYLNSPETPVFDKSRALYGIDRAREGIRRLGAPILVEGQVDLLMAHQAGFGNVIATSGTAFTEGHAELLKRYSSNLLISYDGDRAGIAAAGRAASIALGVGMDVKVAKLPPGVDPADLIKEDAPAFKEAVKGALHIVDFYLAHIADAKYDPRTFRLEVSRTVLPYVALIQNAIDRAHFVKRVAETLGVAEDAVIAEVKKLAKSEELRVKSPNVSSSHLKTLDSQLASSEPFLSRGDVIERLVSGLVTLFKERGEEGEAAQAEKALKDAGVLGRDIVAADEPDADTRAALFEADFFLDRHTDLNERKNALDELYADLARESAHERYRETLALLRIAETSKDFGRTEELMKELSRLAGAL